MTTEDIKHFLQPEGTTVVEELSDTESEHEHEHGPGCCHDHDDHSHDTSASGRQIGRNEKKARKIISKLGLKPLDNIQRVTLKRAKNIIFAINQPDVYKIPNSDTYIIFGEAKFEDLSAQWQRSAMAAAQQAQAHAGSMPSYDATKTGSLSDATNGTGSTGSSIEGDDGEVTELDETGLDSKNIETVISQTGVSRAKAVEALRDANNDIVNAIMALTM